MKKNQIRGIIVIAVVLAAYLVLALLIPFTKNGMYWVGFIFGIIAIIVSAVGIIIAFARKESARSRFYEFPIARISVIYLVVQMVVSFLCMGLAFIAPAWPGIIVCVILLVLAVLGLVATDATRDQIEQVDEKHKADTKQMVSLRSKAAALAGLCSDAECRKAVADLADQFRYSDPISSDATRELEGELDVMLGEIQQAAIDGNCGAVAELCRKAQLQLNERNRLCRLNK